MIDDLTRQPGWDVLVDWLHQRRTPVAQAVLGGQVSDPKEYHTATGFLRGIQEVLDAPARVRELASNEYARREELRLSLEEEA